MLLVEETSLRTHYRVDGIVFRDDLHRAVFGGGVGAGHEVIALGARAGGDDAALSARLEEKELEWFNQHVLHVAATDILGYLEKLRRFLKRQHSLLNSSTGVSA